MAKDNDRYYNPLHCACKNNASIDVVSKLTEVGRSELVLAKDDIGSNSLHTACHYNASISVVSKLIQAAGKDLLWAKNEYGENSLHTACESKARIDLISKLIDVGGKDLIWAKNENGENSLHYACKNNTSIDVVSKLIEVGGKALALAKDNKGFNSLRCACEENTLVKALLDLLAQHSGAELFTQTDESGRTPLQLFVAKGLQNDEEDSDNDEWSQDDSDEQDVDYTVPINNASLLISKGIEVQVEGEYDIGGLFSSASNQEVQNRIYENWDNIVLPALEQVMALPHVQNLPILQAIIANKAPPKVIKSAVNCFEESINTTDSIGMYPIDLAVRHKLLWKDGMKEIVETFASAKQTMIFHVCVKHGVQWENGTKEVLGGSDVDIVEREDISTGLYPFMIAAVRESYGYDLDVVFHLIKASPKLVLRFGDRSEEEQRSRKRKRS